MKYPKRCQYKHAKQKKYHVRNWAEYNEGLRRRGDLTVWFDEEAIANWKADKTGKPGGQRVYSDMAIETGLVVRMVYKLAYRQTEGFLHSIASLLGLGIEIPDYSTLCRRSRLLRKKRRCCTARSKSLTSLMPVAESPGAVRIGHPERGHLVEYLAPNSVFNSLPRQRSCSHLRPDDRFVTIDRVLHHASLGEA